MRWTARVEAPARMAEGACCVNVHGVVYNFLPRPSHIPVHVFNADSYCWEEVSISEDEGWANLKSKYEENRYFQIHHFTAGAFGENVYVLASVNYGLSMMNTSVLYCFNTRTFIWSLVETFAPDLEMSFTSCVVGSSMYVFNSHGGERVIDYRLDLLSFAWSSLACRRYASNTVLKSSFTTIGNRVYVFGAFSRQAKNNDLHYLDTGSLTWHGVPRIAGKEEGWPRIRGEHSAVNLRGRLFIFGGGRSQMSLWLFDPSRGTWSQERPLGPGPEPRIWNGIFQIGEKIVIFGGQGMLQEALPCRLGSLYSVRLTPWDDLFVLDLSPRLKTSCIKAILDGSMSTKQLPPPLQMEVEREKEFRNEVV